MKAPAPGFAEDPHSEQGTACPANHFGFTDHRRLAAMESIYVSKRSFQLLRTPTKGNFDNSHLTSIHRFLFQDVFPWAGSFRVVDISKGDSNFRPARHLKRALAELWVKLAKEQALSNLDPKVFAERAAYFLGELNAIHPFREGNGRTQREFLRQLALQAGHTIVWERTSQLEMTTASIRSHLQGDNSGLEAIISRCLKPVAASSQP